MAEDLQHFNAFYKDVYKLISDLEANVAALASNPSAPPIQTPQPPIQGQPTPHGSAKMFRSVSGIPGFSGGEPKKWGGLRGALRWLWSGQQEQILIKRPTLAEYATIVQPIDEVAETIFSRIVEDSTETSLTQLFQKFKKDFQMLLFIHSPKLRDIFTAKSTTTPEAPVAPTTASNPTTPSATVPVHSIPINPNTPKPFIGTAITSTKEKIKPEFVEPVLIELIKKDVDIADPSAVRQEVSRWGKGYRGSGLILRDYLHQQKELAAQAQGGSGALDPDIIKMILDVLYRQAGAVYQGDGDLPPIFGNKARGAKPTRHKGIKNS